MKRLILFTLLLLLMSGVANTAQVVDFNPKFNSIRLDSTGAGYVTIRAAEAEKLRILMLGDSAGCGEIFMGGAGSTSPDSIYFTTCDSNDSTAFSAPGAGSSWTWADSSAGRIPYGYYTFRFDAGTTDIDPGSGDIAYNNATPASVTEIFVDDLTLFGYDANAALNLVDTGYIISLSHLSAPSLDVAQFRVTGTADSAGWWTFAVTYIDGGTLPSALDTMLMTIVARDVRAASVTDSVAVALDGDGGTKSRPMLDMYGNAGLIDTLAFLPDSGTALLWSDSTLMMFGKQGTIVGDSSSAANTLFGADTVTSDQDRVASSGSVDKEWKNVWSQYVFADSLNSATGSYAHRLTLDSILHSGVWITDFEGTNLSVTAGVLNATGGGDDTVLVVGDVSSNPDDKLHWGAADKLLMEDVTANAQSLIFGSTTDFLQILADSGLTVGDTSTITDALRFMTTPHFRVDTSGGFMDLPYKVNALTANPATAGDNFVWAWESSVDSFVFQAQTGGAGEANTISAIGETETNADSLTAGKSGVDLRIKSLVAGTNITFTPSDTTLLIDATGGGVTDTTFVDTTAGGGAPTDSIVNHTYLQQGQNINLTVVGDTTFIAAVDSVAYATDAGDVDTAGTDIAAALANRGTPDTVFVDTTGGGGEPTDTIDNKIYVAEGQNIEVSAVGDTVLISAADTVGYASDVDPAGTDIAAALAGKLATSGKAADATKADSALIAASAYTSDSALIAASAYTSDSALIAATAYASDSALIAGSAYAFPDGTRAPLVAGTDGQVLAVATTPTPDSSYWKDDATGGGGGGFWDTTATDDTLQWTPDAETNLQISNTTERTDIIADDNDTLGIGVTDVTVVIGPAGLTSADSLTALVIRADTIHADSGAIVAHTDGSVDANDLAAGAIDNTDLIAADVVAGVDIAPAVAGAGLAQDGSGNLDVGAGVGVTVNANDVAVDTAHAMMRDFGTSYADVARSEIRDTVGVSGMVLLAPTVNNGMDVDTITSLDTLASHVAFTDGTVDANDLAAGAIDATDLIAADAVEEADINWPITAIPITEWAVEDSLSDSGVVLLPVTRVDTMWSVGATTTQITGNESETIWGQIRIPAWATSVDSIQFMVRTSDATNSVINALSFYEGASVSYVNTTADTTNGTDRSADFMFSGGGIVGEEGNEPFAVKVDLTLDLDDTLFFNAIVWVND